MFFAFMSLSKNLPGKLQKTRSMGAKRVNPTRDLRVVSISVRSIRRVKVRKQSIVSNVSKVFRFERKEQFAVFSIVGKDRWMVQEQRETEISVTTYRVGVITHPFQGTSAHLMAAVRQVHK